MRKLNSLAVTASLVAMSCFAGDKKPARVLTDAEKQTSYDMSVSYLKGALNLPPTVRFQPIEEARFSTGIKKQD